MGRSRSSPDASAGSSRRRVWSSGSKVTGLCGVSVSAPESPRVDLVRGQDGGLLEAARVEPAPRLLREPGEVARVEPDARQLAPVRAQPAPGLAGVLDALQGVV